MRVKTCLIGLAFALLCSCNQLSGDQKDIQAFRQEVNRLKMTSTRLSKQVEELTKLTADLQEQVVQLRESRSAASSKPAEFSATPPVEPRKTPTAREPQAAPGLCDIIETHIQAVEGVLSQPDLDSAETLLDDLQAAFDANLRPFAQNPKIQQIRAAAATMRNEYIAAAKQTSLANNPYLKNVRQKSLTEARKATRSLRALCEE